MSPCSWIQIFSPSLSSQGWRWGFVSGAEPPSARFVLQERLGLIDPPLIAMGDAPDKPDPTGLIRLAEQLAAGEHPQRIAYIGDTVADVTTVINARRSDQTCLGKAWPLALPTWRT
jgi:HAD superfamily phosphatase